MTEDNEWTNHDWFSNLMTEDNEWTNHDWFSNLMTLKITNRPIMTGPVI